jgi:AcrR family transcriptional regulator
LSSHHGKTKARSPTGAPRRLRRQPQQARGTKRREDILEATGRLLDREGYEATTTTAIAKEAGTSVGTVYEYFSDRDALVRALLELYRGRLRVVLETALAGADLASWRSIASRAFDAFTQFYRREPGYRILWLESQTTPALRESGLAWADEFGAMLDALFGRLLPDVSARRRQAIARTCMYMVSGMTSMALSGPPELVPSMLRESKLALESYLAQVVETSST